MQLRGWGWGMLHVLSRRYRDLTGVSTGSEDNAPTQGVDNSGGGEWGMFACIVNILSLNMRQ